MYTRCRYYYYFVLLLYVSHTTYPQTHHVCERAIWWRQRRRRQQQRQHDKIAICPGCRDAAGPTRVVLAHKTNAPINQLGFLGFAVTHVRFSEETSGSGGPWSGEVPLPDVRLRLRTTTKPPRRRVSSYLTRKHSARVNHCLTRR